MATDESRAPALASGSRGSSGQRLLRGGPQLAAALANLEKGMKDELLQKATKAAAEVLEEAWKARASSMVGLGPGTAHFVEAIESSARPGKRGATGIVRLGKETHRGGRGPARRLRDADRVRRSWSTSQARRCGPHSTASRVRCSTLMSDELRSLIEAAV